MAGVPAFHEASAETRHVDLYRAGTRAGLARQAFVERLLDLLLELRIGAAFRPALAQPFPHQRRAALGRIPAVIRGLIGRAHDLVLDLVETGAIAVAGNCALVLVAQRFGDLPL